MAMIVGITGGIGSGKTTACEIFRVLGIKVFNSDIEAKNLYFTDKQLESAVIHEFGEDVYPNGEFAKNVLASKVFGNPEKLAKLNSLVYPALGRVFSSWCENYSNELYLIKEAAVLIESGAYKSCDRIGIVSCPQEIRIDRVVARDGVSRDEVKTRMRHQLSDAERLKFASFEIRNEGKEAMTPQIVSVHKHLIEEAQTHRFLWPPSHQ